MSKRVFKRRPTDYISTSLVPVFRQGETKSNCLNCEEEFYLQQPHQVYCDAACKQQAYRKRQKINENKTLS